MGFCRVMAEFGMSSANFTYSFRGWVSRPLRLGFCLWSEGQKLKSQDKSRDCARVI